MGKKDKETIPQPPKKALTPFFLYRGEVYEKVKADNPKAKITQLTKIIGEMWGIIDSDTKSRLEHEYEKNKVKVAKEKEAYERKYGAIEPRSSKKGKRIVRRNTRSG